MAVAVQTIVREVMDIRQASEYLGISGDTLYRYASEGFIPAFKLGNRWRFKKSLLDAWMDEKSGVRVATPVAVMPKTEEAGSAGSVAGFDLVGVRTRQRGDGCVRGARGGGVLDGDPDLLVGEWEAVVQRGGQAGWAVMLIFFGILMVFYTAFGTSGN